MPTRVRTISFYNQEFASSISTDAFCGRAIEGQRVGSLGGEIISALERREILKEEKFELGGRGAVRQLVRGEMDGVPMVVDLVMVKKDECVFDFYTVMPYHARPEVEEAFRGFYGGFQYE